MQIRRIYNAETGEFQYLKVITHNRTQKFTQKVINDLAEEGLLSIVKGKITIHSKPEELVYEIKRKPGYYCCFDDKNLPNEEQAREYVEKNFPGQQSPDPQNPAGYRKDSFFFCELIESEVTNNV